MAKIQEDIIRNSIPENLKEKGLAKLGTYVTNEAMKFADKIIPTLEKQLKEFENQCPPLEKIEQIINLRNNILGQANSISDVLDGVTKTVGLANTGINTLVGVIKGVNSARFGASIAAKLIPAGLPGAVPAALNDFDTAVTKLTFDVEGNSKIPPVRSAIDGISVPIELLSSYILQFTTILEQLDNFIKNCTESDSNLGSNVNLGSGSDPKFKLDPISLNLIEIASIQKQSNQSSNSSTYQGFIIEIEEVPFSSTVNRRKAVGKNQDGIVLVQTELSFTPSNQILIDELKFIIDRDNLKAY